MTIQEKKRSDVQLVRGHGGVVASGHELATQAALDVLRAGGNAVDAAIAGAFVLTVTCPYAVTLAGDVYMLIRDPRTGEVTGLNGTGCAPRAATLDRFEKGPAGEGPHAVTVPGLVDGLWSAWTKFGSRPWAELIAPSEKLARDGFEVNAYFNQNLKNRSALLAKNETAAAIFLPNGAPLAVGSQFRQRDVADCLAMIAADGAETFYRGALAKCLCRAGAEAGWLLGEADFADHATLHQRPVRAPFYGREVWTMPPNSYGGTLLLQLLALEDGGIAAVDPDSADFIVRGFDARRSAYRACAGLIADPAAVEDKFCAMLETRIRERVIAPTGGATPPESRDKCTTNICVIDRDGLAVSLIESISAPCGSGVVLPGTGILLNNRLAGFNADPSSPNCLAPGKRPAHTLAPCLVTGDADDVWALGTPGTVGQTCSLAQYLARILACGQDAASAATRPRWSVDFTGKPVFEETMDAGLRAELLAMAPDFRPMPVGWISFGSIKQAQADQHGMTGLADYRRCATAGVVASSTSHQTGGVHV